MKTSGASVKLSLRMGGCGFESSLRLTAPTFESPSIRMTRTGASTCLRESRRYCDRLMLWRGALGLICFKRNAALFKCPPQHPV